MEKMAGMPERIRIKAKQLKNFHPDPRYTDPRTHDGGMDYYIEKFIPVKDGTAVARRWNRSQYPVRVLPPVIIPEDLKGEIQVKGWRGKYKGRPAYLRQYRVKNKKIRDVVFIGDRVPASEFYYTKDIPDIAYKWIKDKK